MNERVYTINEIRSLISESVNEIKAKIGDKVESTNKKENEKAYKDAKKRVKDFDGGGNEDKKERNLPNKEDGNKTTLDYALDGDPGSDFNKRIKAQAEGYTSTLEKENGIEKIGDFSDDTYQQFKKAGKEMAKNVEDDKKRGLTASKAPEGTFKKDSMYESNKISVLNFKNTTFINESQMISRIPDDYKVDGKRFKMKDASENEFIVEWADGEAKILFHENKRKLNEAMNKFHKLIDYKSKNQFTTSTSQSRLNETNSFNTILNKARIISEKK
jgi:hypothetical protein